MIRWWWRRRVSGASAPSVFLGIVGDLSQQCKPTGAHFWQAPSGAVARRLRCGAVRCGAVAVLRKPNPLRTRYGLGFASRPEVDPCGSGEEERHLRSTEPADQSADPVEGPFFPAATLSFRTCLAGWMAIRWNVLLPAQAQMDNTGQRRGRTVVPALVKKYDSSMRYESGDRELTKRHVHCCRHLFGHCPEGPELRNVQSAS
ncbi:hypothetical protein EDB83DRAFT_1918804 [Lactarius deliciosus]|nr:hypothetical protein EDB83DRAFT_1918804 [Lactarius deliciosus]